MNPAIIILVGWLLFGGTHLLLSRQFVRAPLVDALGNERFIVLYTFIAATSLLLLSYFAFRYAGYGASAFTLKEEPGWYWLLAVISFLGTTLMLGGLINYMHSLIAFLARSQRTRLQGNGHGNNWVDRTGMSVISRHPFFLGLSILMIAHIGLASTLAQAAYFAGFAVLAMLGIRTQDRKLVNRHGMVYSKHLDESPILIGPMAFDRLQKRGKGLIKLFFIAALLAVAFTLLHPFWKFGNGFLFAVCVALFGTLAVLRQYMARSDQ